jgi:hypothetical protein
MKIFEERILLEKELAEIIFEHEMINLVLDEI